MDMRQYLGLFVSEARQHLEEVGNLILALEREPDDGATVDALFRHAHSLKGMAAAMEFSPIAELAHAMEDLMEGVRKMAVPFTAAEADLLLKGTDLLLQLVAEVEEHGAPVSGCSSLIRQLRGRVEKPDAGAPPTGSAALKNAAEGKGEGAGLRLSSDFLDSLVTVTGGLVTVKQRLSQLAEEGSLPAMQEAVRELGRHVRELQDRVLQARLLPFSHVAQRFPRVVRDLARTTGKDIALRIEGGSIEVDRGIVEALGDALLHLLRNAVDHGIETREERETAGKPLPATIVIEARREKDHIIVSATDDGRGLDHDRIVATAVAKGLIPPDAASALSPGEVALLTCVPGFSTAERVTELSGRGVGLDAVMDIVNGFGGTLFIETEREKGTSISLKFPRSTAIVTVMLMRCGMFTVGIPFPRIVRMLEIPAAALQGREAVAFGGEELPVRSLPALLGQPQAEAAWRPAFVTESSEGKLIFTVDAVLRQQEVFVRPVAPPLNALAGLAGHAVLPDGSGIYILDVAALTQRRPS